MLEDKLRIIKKGIVALGLATTLIGCSEFNTCDDPGDDKYAKLRSYSSDTDGGMSYTEKNCGGSCTYFKESDCCKCPEPDSDKDYGRDFRLGKR